MISHKLFMNHLLDNWFFKCVLWPPLAHMKTQWKHGGNNLVCQNHFWRWSGKQNPHKTTLRKWKENKRETALSSREQNKKWNKKKMQLGAAAEARAVERCWHQWSSQSPTTAFNGSGKIHHTCFFTVCVYVCADVCVGPCVCVYVCVLWLFPAA